MKTMGEEEKGIPFCVYEFKGEIRGLQGRYDELYNKEYFDVWVVFEMPYPFNVTGAWIGIPVKSYTEKELVEIVIEKIKERIDKWAGKQAKETEIEIKRKVLRQKGIAEAKKFGIETFEFLKKE